MDLAATDDNLILLLVFFGLYLADCVVVLRPAQALADLSLPARGRKAVRRSAGWPSRCRVVLDFGLTVYPVRGRYLAFLNPLTPFRAVFKTRPIDETDGGRARPLSLRQMASLRLRTARMSIALISHGILLFVILPLLLLSGQTERLLIAVGAAFVSAILILAVCYLDRRAARLASSGFWAVAGQALLCLPVSLNAPRKLALLSCSVAQAAELIAMVPEDRRVHPLAELRLTLDRATHDGSDSLAVAAAVVQQRLAADYPEA